MEAASMLIIQDFYRDVTFLTKYITFRGIFMLNPVIRGKRHRDMRVFRIFLILCLRGFIPEQIWHKNC